MRKYILFVLAALLAVAMIGLGTFAIFTDTETVTGTFEAGTILLGLETTQQTFEFTDLKPCDTEYWQGTLVKEGTNDGPIWLHISNYSGLLAEVIDLDLKIDGVEVISSLDEMSLKDLYCVSINLGWLGNDPVPIELSFHLRSSAGNEYQGASCSATFDFIMTDHNAPPPTSGIILENKNAGSGWNPILGDGIWGICRYEVGSLDLDVVGKGLNASTVYQVGITSPEDASWYPLSAADREELASALASGVYASGAGMGTAPPAGFNLFERGYCAPGGGSLNGSYAAGNVGVYTFTNSGVTPGGVLGSALAAGVSKSCALPSGDYKYIKVIIKVDASPYTAVLMEKDTPLFFTIP